MLKMTKREEIKYYYNQMDVRISYEGEVKNGKPHGHGQLTFWADQLTHDLWTNLKKPDEGHYTQHTNSTIFHRFFYLTALDNNYISDFDNTNKEVWYNGTFDEGNWHGKFYRNDFYSPYDESVDPDSVENWDDFVEEHSTVEEYEFKNNVMVYGVLEWGEGQYWGHVKEEWQENSSKNILMPHGEGELKYPDGKVVEGEWTDGKLLIKK